MTDYVRLYRDKVDRLVQAILTGRGASDPSLRTAIHARAAAAGGSSRAVPDTTLHPAVDLYASKVAHHAYDVTDADVDALKGAGYSEDAIFELTVSAAVGAAVGRLERGLRALRGNGV